MKILLLFKESVPLLINIGKAYTMIYFNSTNIKLSDKSNYSNLQVFPIFIYKEYDSQIHNRDFINEV